MNAGRRLPGAQQGLEEEAGGQEASHLRRQTSPDCGSGGVGPVSQRNPPRHGARCAVQKGARSDFPVQGTILYSIFANAGQAYALQSAPGPGPAGRSSAPTSTITLTRNATKSGVCVGSVPAPGRDCFLPAREPAMARMGIMSQNLPTSITTPSSDYRKAYWRIARQRRCRCCWRLRRRHRGSRRNRAARDWQSLPRPPWLRPR